MILPDIILKEQLDKLIKRYYLEYKNTNQANIIGTVNLPTGFNWATTNQQLIINGETLTFNQNTTNITEVVNYFNTLIQASTLNNIVAYNAGQNRVGLITNVTDGSIQTIIITDSTAVDTFGFVIGTFAGTNDKTQTRLYLIYKDLQYDDYNWFDETVKILIDTYETKKRPIKVFQHYNKVPYSGAINLIISFTGEQQGEKNVGPHRTAQNGNDNIYEIFDKYDARYLIHVVSDNYNEVALIYTFLKAIIRGNYHVFSFAGLDDFKINGGNPRIETEMPDLFDWGLELSFDYHYVVPFGFYRYYPAEELELNLEKINDQDIQ